MAFSSPGKSLGVNVLLTHTTAKHPLGLRVMSNDGTEYVYVKAGEALAVKDALKGVIGTTTAQGPAEHLNGVLKTTAAASPVIGVTTVAIASGSYGFVAAKGYVAVNLVSSGVAPGDYVRSSATAGALTAKGETDTIEGICGFCTADDASNAGSVFLNV